jgi:hypothetical protein
VKIYPNPVKADLFIDSDLSEAAAPFLMQEEVSSDPD